jgi:glycosyltransferase involved in cell wall biosynthesis
MAIRMHCPPDGMPRPLPSDAPRQPNSIPVRDEHRIDRQPHVLVIVPAFNESRALPSLLRELRAECPAVDVVVIDDGSTDGTRESAASFARVISLPCNLGIGGAVQTGLQIALREGYDFAVQMDGDGQHPPHELPRLLAAAEETGCDILVGSRFLSGNGFKSTAIRRAGIRVFALVLSATCGASITDSTSGFRVFSKRAIRLLSDRYPEDYPEPEALLIAHRAGLRIGEITVDMAERRAGKSSLAGAKTFVYMMKVPLAIFMNLLRKSEAQL